MGGEEMGSGREGEAIQNPKTPVKRGRRVKKAKKPDIWSIDIEQAKLFFTRQGKEYIIDLLPIDDTNVIRLALERMHQLVKNAKDPYKRADWIKAGRPKAVKAPIVVRAISETSNRPIGEVLDVWRKLSKAERKTLSEDPIVVAARKRLETPANPKPTNTYLDIFG